ncbi:unnamed protein product [Psylliodes chrysocephalus]|uniref:Uncharacterized protein n=1 Tax=Psylliodes chrysocephalus TaxID=3402493 RepID=A0A9P0D2Y0_9CUCU|nr:unnamed protein product [Psylliodes chrysocephala]
MEDNINKHPLCFDIAILDGFFMLHQIKEIPQTFNGLSKKFLSIITQFKASRIDIIFDQYFTPSIEKCKRTPNQIRPHNFTAQLKNMQFKEALVKFFIKHWSTDNMAPSIANKTIYLSLNECYCYQVKDNKFLGDQLPSLIADIIVQDSQVLENNDIPEDNSVNDESNDHNESSDDDNDLKDALF